MARVGEQFSKKEQSKRIEDKKRRKELRRRRKTPEELKSRRKKIQSQEEKLVKKKEGTLLQGKDKAPIELNKPKPKDDRNILQKITGDLPGFHELREEGRLKTGSLPLAPTGAAIGLVKGLGDATGLTGTATATTQAAIQSGFAQQATATAAKFTPTAARSVVPTISKIGQMAINAKTKGLATSFLSKKFGWKAMAFAGTWMSSVFLGQWGQAEAPEAVMIPIRDLIKVAETPEDWAEVDEYLQIAENISDKSIWEEIILWSPFAAIEGIASKMEGVAAGVKILAETAAKAQEVQQREEEQGESDFAKSRRETDEAARERDITAREEDTAFFDKQEEEKKEEDLAEMQWKSEYYALIREGKFEEAEELLQAQ